MSIALDATYSLDPHLSGVGVYSRAILHGLADAYPAEKFRWYYRPHRFLGSFRAQVPSNCRRFLLYEPLGAGGARLFHGLNQRLPKMRMHRSVATFHDLFVMTGDYSTPEFRRRFTALARDAAQRADAIIAVSAFTAGQVQNLLNVEPARIHVVHHGVRGLRFHDGAREAMVLHVGAVQRRKNLLRLVSAFEKLPAEWRLVLAGSAGFGSEEVVQRIELSPARARITVTGYVDAAELERLYHQAGIFAFPSLDEGFGMPVLEAMAAGAPVVASNGSAVAEVAGDAALLVDPLDEDELAQTMQRLAADAHLRNLLVEKGKTRANRFTWKRAVAETADLYKSLA